MGNSWTSVQDRLLESLAKCEHFEVKSRIPWIVIRETMGFNRHSVRMSKAKLAKKIGASLRQTQRAFAELVESGVIIVHEEAKGTKAARFSLASPKSLGVTHDDVTSESLGVTHDDVASEPAHDRSDVTSMSHVSPLDMTHGDVTSMSHVSLLDFRTEDEEPHNQAADEPTPKNPKQTLKTNILKKVFKQSEPGVLKPFDTSVGEYGEGDPRNLIARKIETLFHHLFDHKEIFTKRACDLALEELAKHTTSSKRTKPYRWPDRLGALTMSVDQFKAAYNAGAIKHPWPYVLKMVSSHLDYAAHVNHHNKIERKQGSASGHVTLLPYDWKASVRATEAAKNREARDRNAS